MKRYLSYSSLFASLAIMILSGCSSAPTGVIRPGDNSRGNYNTAEIPQATTTTTRRRDRSPLLSYNPSANDVLQCQTQCQSGNCGMPCQRVIHAALSRGMGPNYFQYQPQVGLFSGLGLGNRQQGQSYVFDYNTFQMADTQWVNEFNANMNAGYTPITNMQAFCGSPSAFMDESVTLPQNHCGNVNVNHLISSQMANNAYYLQRTARPQLAHQELTNLRNYTNCGLKKGKKCVELEYNTYWGTRDLRRDSKVVGQDLLQTWRNVKAWPGFQAKKLANGVLNVFLTQASIPFAQIDAQLAQMNFSAAQILNYHEAMASHYWNSSQIPFYMTGAGCGTADGDEVATQGAFQIGQEMGEYGQYGLSCNAGN